MYIVYQRSVVTGQCQVFPHIMSRTKCTVSVVRNEHGYNLMVRWMAYALGFWLYASGSVVRIGGTRLKCCSFRFQVAIAIAVHGLSTGSSVGASRASL